MGEVVLLRARGGVAVGVKDIAVAVMDFILRQLGRCGAEPEHHPGVRPVPHAVEGDQFPGVVNHLVELFGVPVVARIGADFIDALIETVIALFRHLRYDFADIRAGED
ncbi:hypothetical protein SDC9_200097 [bioreactor metagenome]|uniref:Uncharacterized protein n=1 Tax=bioreactor metagenome TaxID=1076179 RepID=A0A645IMZ3_9ZZZZ